MRVSADTVSSDIGATEIGIAPPLSARSRLPLSFREAANESGAVDGFDATVATGNVSGARTRSRPEPVVPGPIPEADQPRDAARDVARVVTIVVGLGAIAAAATLGFFGAISIALGVLIAILGAIAFVVGLALEQPVRPADDGGGVNTFEFVNFSGEVAFTPEHYHRPSTEAEVVDIVRRATAAGERVKVIGSAHSFVGTFETDQHLVSLERLNFTQVVDRARGIVRIGAGAKLHDINDFLATQGLAMANLGGIAEQSIVGALQTGTHGSGGAYGILATQVERMRLLTADGDVRWISRASDPELFSAALVGLGALGIITEVEIRAVPAFNLEEHVRRTTFEDAFDQAHIEERVAAHDHFQMIWTPHADTTFLVERDRTDLPASAPEWADAPREENPLRLLAANAALGLSAIRALRPLMMRLLSETARSEMLHRGRSDAILTRPAGPMQRETEYAFPIARASEAMYALREAVEEEGLLMNFPCCMRFVRGDDIMLSPANRSVSGGEGGGDSAYISVLLTGSSEEDDRVMHVVQRVMREHGGRPHWGKELDLTAAEAREEYGERYDRFRALLDVLDPTGTFRNPYIDRFFPR